MNGDYALFYTSKFENSKNDKGYIT